MSNIGYIINDIVTEATNVSVSNNTGKPIAEGILQDTNVDNRNGRYYDSKDLFPELKSERFLELLHTGNLKGENGHPMSQDVRRQSTIDPNNTVVKFLDVWTEGNNIMARFTGTNNELGRSFDQDLLCGEKPSFSLRALGSIENKNGHAYVKNIRIITWDRVIYPSHKKAYTQRLVSESADVTSENGIINGSKVFVEDGYKGMIVPITNEKVIETIKTESTNVQSIIGTFGGLYESVSVLDNGRQVQLCDGKGHVFIVNLESHVQDLLMKYCG